MSRANELVAAFDVYEGRYLREEVEEAITLRNEITPLLIGILEEIAANPVSYAAKEHYAEVYAVALLAHFREARAHIPIIQAFNIPNEQLSYIWGDILTETLPALLCRTSGGDYSQIMQLIRDRKAYTYLRASAMDAVTMGIMSGDISREKGVTLFATLFDETLANPKNYFWAALVCNLLDIYPGELVREIEDLFTKGLVPKEEVSFGEVEEVMAQGLDATILMLKEKREAKLPEDVQDYIPWF